MNCLWATCTSYTRQRTLIFYIAFVASLLHYLISANASQSHTSEYLFIQPLTTNNNPSGSTQYIVDYTFTGFELYPWSHEGIYDRNTFSHSTDVLPKDILKLLKTSECSHFIATIGDGHFDNNKFNSPPVNIVSNGSTLLANLPRNYVEKSWLVLTHGLWGLTGVSYNMSKSPIVLSSKEFVGKDKSVFDDLKLRIKQVFKWAEDWDDNKFYLDTREDPRRVSKLETMEDLLYKLNRRERSLCFDNLVEENLCTDNLHSLELLLPCGFKKGLAAIFSNLSHLVSSEYKGAKLSASLHNGRYYFTLNVHYISNGSELSVLESLDENKVKCYSIDESQIFVRSGNESIVNSIGSIIGDGSYVHTPKIQDLSEILKGANTVNNPSITVKYEEMNLANVNRRISSILLITIANHSLKPVKIASITALPKWIVPLGHTLLIYNGADLLCSSESCFNTPGIKSSWVLNDNLTPDTRSNIQFVTSVAGESKLFISFQILKNLINFYSMNFGELRGQIIPGTVVFYQDKLNIWPESYRSYLSKIAALSKINQIQPLDMTKQEFVLFKSLVDEMADGLGFTENVKYLVSNPLILKIILPDHTMSYNAMVISGIVIGLIFTFVYKSTVVDVEDAAFEKKIN